MKRKISELTKLQKIETLDALYTAASGVQGRDAVKLFLRDLLTESERVMLGRRILIARKLLEGESSRSISGGLGVGLDTVWRVERWLYDQMPGYENAIAGMKKEFAKRKFKKPTAKAEAVAYLKKRYPLHFLFSSSKNR